MLTLTSPVKKIRRFGVFPRVDVSFVCFASVSSHLRVQRAVPILAAKGELPRGDFLGEILTWPHPAAPEEAEHLACFGGNTSFNAVAARRFASPALRHSATSGVEHAIRQLIIGISDRRKVFGGGLFTKIPEILAKKKSEIIQECLGSPSSPL